MPKEEQAGIREKPSAYVTLGNFRKTVQDYPDSAVLTFEDNRLLLWPIRTVDLANDKSNPPPKVIMG